MTTWVTERRSETFSPKGKDRSSGACGSSGTCGTRGWRGMGTTWKRGQSRVAVWLAEGASRERGTGKPFCDVRHMCSPGKARRPLEPTETAALLSRSPRISYPSGGRPCPPVFLREMNAPPPPTSTATRRPAPPELAAWPPAPCRWMRLSDGKGERTSSPCTCTTACFTAPRVPAGPVRIFGGMRARPCPAAPSEASCWGVRTPLCLHVSFATSAPFYTAPQRATLVRGSVKPRGLLSLAQPSLNSSVTSAGETQTDPGGPSACWTPSAP